MNYSKISFPEDEWEDIKRYLKENGQCSTVRCCNELNKYKDGQIWEAPWGELIKIKKVERYKQAESLPYWEEMTEEMKESVKQGKEWDYVVFVLNN